MIEKYNGKNVLFLDVDGVLNTSSTCVCTPSGVCIGIDETRIAILANAMKKVGMEGVILTSTWKDLREDNEDYVYLISSLDKHGVKVLGKTTEEHLIKREEGVLDYLKEHPEIEEFVIIDDNHFGFGKYSKLFESFVDTKGNGIEHSVAASKTPSVPAILFLSAIQGLKKGK